jgi:cytochrome c-type biogenesis protein CcmH
VKRVGILSCIFFSLSVAAAPVSEDPLERQVLEIAKELRCAVCQNQPISESNSDLARDMRKIIREQLQAGKPREEIVQYFVDRYGNYVLMKPPVRGPGALLWGLPLLIAAVLAVSAFVYLRQRRRVAAPDAPKLSKQDAALVDAARRQDKS